MKYDFLFKIQAQNSNQCKNCSFFAHLSKLVKLSKYIYETKEKMVYKKI